MAAAGEWREKVGCLKLTSSSNVPSINSAHNISTHTEATQILLTWEL